MNRNTLIRIGLIGSFLFILFLLFRFFVNEKTQLLSVQRNSSPEISETAVSRLIEARIGKNPSTLVVAGEHLHSPELLQKFYKSRIYRPAWIEDGHLTQADQLISAAEESYADGLPPSYYHLDRIKILAWQAGSTGRGDPEPITDLEILLTDAFLTLGCHLSGGCLNPVTERTEWYAKRGKIDISALLEKAVEKKNAREILIGLRPERVVYKRLKEALARYREISMRGNWTQVTGSGLKPGTTSLGVIELRKRLAASGDLKGGDGGEFFDDELKEAVISFQQRHGLKDDGVVGPATLEALNVPLGKRIRQIELNLERLRWILGNEEERAIFINIANFELDVIENGKTVLPMKVVVGKRYWNTPVFTAKMTHLIINPYWNIPDSIAREEVIEHIQKDPDYLARQRIKVFSRGVSGEVEIDPATIDWSDIRPDNVKWRFRQEPGPMNPLGHIKFVLPNKFDVYLHDTPSKGLFSKQVRMFSHGCTRVEKPVELAEYLLRDAPGWDRDKIIAEIENAADETVRIPRPINVHFLYLTAWVDEAGILHFRDDIYDRDRLLDEALLADSAPR